MPEEKFDDKKLEPILREAYDLLTWLEGRKTLGKQQIQDIRRKTEILKQQKERAKELSRNIDLFEEALKEEKERKKNTKSLTIEQEENDALEKKDRKKSPKELPVKLLLFKTIMCPHKEKCVKDTRKRWPLSNIPCVTKLGVNCPYAHHPMELEFPEMIETKIAANSQLIKKARLQMDVIKPEKPFVPAGHLYDCQGGCNSKQPCNLCKYKTDNFKRETDVPKKQEMLLAALEKKAEDNESPELKDICDQLKEAKKLIDLDKNFVLKFGLLKKASVLQFYDRTNDAFSEITKAVKIIRNQKEAEKNKTEAL